MPVLSLNLACICFWGIGYLECLLLLSLLLISERHLSVTVEILAESYPPKKLVKFTGFCMESSQYRSTAKPVLSDHLFSWQRKSLLAGGCFLLNISSAESSCMSFLHYFHTAISNHLSVKVKNMSCFIWLLNTGLTVQLLLQV